MVSAMNAKGRMLLGLRPLGKVDVSKFITHEWTLEKSEGKCEMWYFKEYELIFHSGT